MAYVITEDCIRCKYQDCVQVCPVDCFHEGANMLVIDPEECIDCGLCVPECEANAIIEHTDAGGERWLKLNEEYAMTASDTEDIMALDLVKVDNQIKSFAKLDLIRGNVNLAASHTKNSHTSHSKDAHSNSSHSNGADRLSSLRMDELATREEIR